MSDKQQNRMSSGEFSQIETRRAEDGSIEFIMEPAGLEERSSPRHAAQESERSEPDIAPAPSSRRPVMIAGGVALALIVLGLGAAAIWGGDKKAPESKDLASEWSSSLPQNNFKAYDGPAEVPAAARIKAKPKPRVINEEQLSPEEREAWRLAESTGQDVVYEDEGVEDSPTPQPAVSAAKPVVPDELADESRLFKAGDGRPNARQIEMLREMNKRLAQDPEAFRNVKVDSAANKRLKMGLPYKLNPIKKLPINPNPPSGEHQLPKTPNPTYLPDVYGDGPTPGEPVVP